MAGVDTTTSESIGGRWRVWTQQHRSQPGEGGGCGHDNKGVNRGKVAGVDTTTSESTGGTCGYAHGNIGINRGKVAGVDTTIRAPVVLDVDMDATTVRSAEGTCNSRCS